jgi:hypothetical protein
VTYCVELRVSGDGREAQGRPYSIVECWVWALTAKAIIITINRR